jgi:hypothetical protein
VVLAALRLPLSVAVGREDLEEGREFLAGGLLLGLDGLTVKVMVTFWLLETLIEVEIESVGLELPEVLDPPLVLEE